MVMPHQVETLGKFDLLRRGRWLHVLRPDGRRSPLAELVDLSHVEISAVRMANWPSGQLSDTMSPGAAARTWSQASALIGDFGATASFNTSEATFVDHDIERGRSAVLAWY